jgi:hypothetical protein
MTPNLLPSNFKKKKSPFPQTPKVLLYMFNSKWWMFGCGDCFFGCGCLDVWMFGCLDVQFQMVDVWMVGCGCLDVEFQMVDVQERVYARQM